MKRPNPTIGMIECPICDELGAVRKDKRHRLYYVCHCGTHPAHGEKGTERLLAKATIWGAEGTPPADAPDWIKRGLGHPPGTRSPFSRPRTPLSPPPPPPPPPPAVTTDPADDPEAEDDECSVFGFR